MGSQGKWEFCGVKASSNGEQALEDEEKQASFSRLAELIGDASKMFFYSIGRIKFEQACLESYAKKLGLYPVEPGSFWRAEQYFT